MDEPNDQILELGLLGFPLEHSFSPRLHQAALQYAGIPGNYKFFPIPPDEHCQDRLAEIIDQMRSGDINGLNVTIPYKQTIIPFMDSLSPEARVVGAVNTVYLSDSKLIGANTDIIGFSRDLENFGLDYKDHPAASLVLGAGGASRSVVYVLINAGWKVVVAARRRSQSEALSADIKKHFPCARIVPAELSGKSIDPIIKEISLVVNATPAGMFPLTGFSPWPEGMPFPQDAYVYDLVYNPGETRLLADARSAGVYVRNGYGMLIEQAAASFELWTGINCPASVLWNCSPS